jgi:hypothetical protein
MGYFLSPEMVDQATELAMDERQRLVNWLGPRARQRATFEVKLIRDLGFRNMGPEITLETTILMKINVEFGQVVDEEKLAAFRVAFEALKDGYRDATTGKLVISEGELLQKKRSRLRELMCNLAQEIMPKK